MSSIFWIIGCVLFLCFGLVVVSLVDQDINKMMKISKLELYLTIPISILLWIYESYKMNNWSIFTDKWSIILIYFLGFNVVFLLLIGNLYRRQVVKRKIPLHYYKRNNHYFSLENATFRVFTFSFVTVLAGTIWIIYSVIVNYN